MIDFSFPAGWIGLAVLAMLFNVAKVLAVRTVCRQVDPSVLVFYARLLPAILLILPAAASGYRIDDAATFWGATLLAAILTLFASILYVRAVQIGDLALVAPMQSTVPAFMIVTTFLLYDEVPTPSALGLILVIVCAVAYVLLRASTATGSGSSDRWILPASMSLLAAAVYGVSTVVDRVALAATTQGVLLYAACWHLVTVALLVVYFARHHRYVLAQGRTQSAGIWTFAAVTACAFVSQQFAVQGSMQIDNGVTFVKTIVMLHIGIAAVAGILLLKEKPASDLMIANGIALLSGLALVLVV